MSFSTALYFLHHPAKEGLQTVQTPFHMKGSNESCTNSSSIISWQRPFFSYFRKSNLSTLSLFSDQQGLSNVGETQMTPFIGTSGLILVSSDKHNSEKAIAPPSSTLAGKIPWTEEPGGLQSMGLLWAGHDWVTSLSIFTFMHWRRKWQPTPVFLPGESQGRGNLVGCHLWSRTESDTTEAT